jgi:hypothetical protein
LVTFGKAFGLALYAGDPRKVNEPSINHARGSSKPNGAGQAKGDHREGRERPEAVPVLAGPNGTAANVPPDGRMEANGSAVTDAKEEANSQRRPIDKSALALAELRRVRDKDHLRYVAAQPCLLCSGTPSDAHHLRFAQARALGRKVGDDFTVPLCRAHHRELHHSGNEPAWWHDMGINAVEVARQLWNETEARR